MKKRGSRVLKFFGVLFVSLTCLGFFSFFSYQVGKIAGEENILTTPPNYLVNPENEKPEIVDFGVFWEVWREIERYFLYQDKIDYQQMTYGAINGMLESLGDPHTSFFNPQETESFDEELSGKYEGVGMYVGVKDDAITVISPLKDSPAAKAGIKPEDKIIEIDDISTAGMTIEKAVSLIKGEKGTEVKLLIKREKLDEPKEFVVKRQLIKIPTLDWQKLENDIAWLRIYQFNLLLPEQLQRAGFEILNSEAKKIILDLRFNPGGYLHVAQITAGWFLERDQVVVIQDSGENNEQEVYKSEGPSAFAKYPTVVLINKGSASASEIVAGALRDQRGIKLVGEKSFGKGSVQEQLHLSEGSSLKVTTSRWLTPNGASIDEAGLTPDVQATLSEDEEYDDYTSFMEGKMDPQLEKAIEILNNIE